MFDRGSNSVSMFALSDTKEFFFKSGNTVVSNMYMKRNQSLPNQFTTANP